MSMPVLVNTEFRQRAGLFIRSPWSWMDDLMGDGPKLTKDAQGHYIIPAFDKEKLAATWLAATELRHEHICTYGFAVLNEAAIAALLPLGQWLEIGAGAAYWAYELERAGGDCLPTDPYPPGIRMKVNPGNNYSLGDKTWTKVLPLPASTAVRLYPNRNLLTIWPSYAEDWAAKALALFQGQYVAYVGEGDGGCTADDAFHDQLNNRFEEVDDIIIPQFYGIHDRLMIYRRRPGNLSVHKGYAEASYTEDQAELVGARRFRALE